MSATELKPGFQRFLSAEFKQEFKVGDVIIGGNMRYPVKISAIGVRHFLGLIPNRFASTSERNFKMRQVEGWKLVEGVPHD